MNSNLTKARVNKKDEFYTRIEDVENELKHYDLSGKVVYCNCDDYRWSAFYKYFKDNFHSLGIKRLVATHYSEYNSSTYTLFDGAYEHTALLKGNGSFDSEECLDILQGVDVVITNPPFSLFRSFIDMLVENGKDFIVLGNLNAISYKNVFPLIRENRVRLGTKQGSITYDTPEGERKLGNTAWFTTLIHDSVPPFLELTEEYCPKRFPKYDNSDAINVDRTKLIPKDFFGVMGVPISSISKLNREQFNILGLANNKVNIGVDFNTIIDGKSVYLRLIVQRAC